MSTWLIDGPGGCPTTIQKSGITKEDLDKGKQADSWLKKGYGINGAFFTHVIPFQSSTKKFENDRSRMGKMKQKGNPPPPNFHSVRIKPPLIEIRTEQRNAPKTRPASGVQRPGETLAEVRKAGAPGRPIREALVRRATKESAANAGSLSSDLGKRTFFSCRAQVVVCAISKARLSEKRPPSEGASNFAIGVEHVFALYSQPY
jgi:hypothetical protein